MRNKPWWAVLVLALAILVLMGVSLTAQGIRPVRQDGKPEPFIGASSFLLGVVFSPDKGSLGVVAVPGVQFRLLGTDKVSLGLGAGALLGYRRDFEVIDSSNRLMVGLAIYLPVTVWRYEEKNQHFGVSVAYVYGHNRLVKSAEGRNYHGVVVGYSVWR